MKKKVLFFVFSIILIFTLTISALAAEIFISLSDYGFDGLKEKQGSYSAKVMQFTGEAGANKYDLTFNAPEDGDYFMWARVYHESPDDNSLLYYDGGKEFIFDAYQEWGGSKFETGEMEWSSGDYFEEFYWVKVGERDEAGIPWNIDHVFKLKAGANTLTIANRENGLIIDMFILTTDKNYDPRKISGNPKPAEAVVLPAPAPVVEEPVVVDDTPVVVDTPPPTPVTPTVPKTSDNILFPVILLIVLAASVYVTIKKVRTVK